MSLAGTAGSSFRLRSLPVAAVLWVGSEGQTGLHPRAAELWEQRFHLDRDGAAMTPSPELGLAVPSAAIPAWHSSALALSPCVSVRALIIIIILIIMIIIIIISLGISRSEHSSLPGAH